MFRLLVYRSAHLSYMKVALKLLQKYMYMYYSTIRELKTYLCVVGKFVCSHDVYTITVGVKMKSRVIR